MSSLAAAFRTSELKYDDLERRMAEAMGLKVLLVRDWKKPDILGLNGTEKKLPPELKELIHAQHGWEAQLYNHQEDRTRSFPHPGESPLQTATRESLRACIKERDFQLGQSIDDMELDGFLQTGHITLRKNNAAPAHTVIVHDMDTTKHERLIDVVVGHTVFSDIYGGIVGSHIPLKNFLRNFDLSPDEVRAHESYRRVHYALAHQHEYEDLKKYRHPRFAIDERTPQGFEASKSMYAWESHYSKKTNERLLPDSTTDKFLYAGALDDVINLANCPQRTIGRILAGTLHKDRLYFHPARFADFQKDLAKTIHEGCRKLVPENDPNRHLAIRPEGDIRILTPVFMHETLRMFTRNRKSALGPFEETYLRVLRHAVEIHFPDLANKPKPKITANGSLPKTADGYRDVRPAKKPYDIAPK